MTAAPACLALAGTAMVAFSPIQFALAEVSPWTGAVLRCSYAVPVLALIVAIAEPSVPAEPLASRLPLFGAGALFAIELISWHFSILYVGAGIATVLNNLQVVLMPALAWLLWRERPARVYWLLVPFVALGVVLVSGALEGGSPGGESAAGVALGLLSGVAYSLFVVALRTGTGTPARSLLDATASAALVTLLASLLLGGADLVPRASSQLWLLSIAFGTQVVAWLAIAHAARRLQAPPLALILTLQPALSILLGWALLGERLAPAQLAGAIAILLVIAVSLRFGPALRR